MPDSVRISARKEDEDIASFQLIYAFEKKGGSKQMAQSNRDGKIQSL